MILRSLRMIGEKARGDTLSSSEQTECLEELNTFMDSCANERLLCYTIEQNSLALTSSTNSYTVGTNGAFAITRPVRIVDPCFVRDSSGFDTPVTVLNTEQYAEIVDKNSGYTVPDALYYDTGFSATSTATLFVYPSPSGSLTLFVNSWKQLGTFANLSTTVLLPPGYQLFIESNFAIHLAAGQTNVSPEVARIARESKAAIRGVNLPSPVMRVESGVLPMYGSSILTG
jgi:hypothetical protein